MVSHDPLAGPFMDAHRITDSSDTDEYAKRVSAVQPGGATAYALARLDRALANRTDRKAA